MTTTNQVLQKLISTIKALRSENGCPWDRRQTNSMLIPHIRSECEELIQAITNNDQENICEEIGDIIYLMIMLAEINSESSHFQLSDTLRGINTKLIRRHPHVFAGTPYENEEQLASQWQAIKADEKKNKSV